MRATSRNDLDIIEKPDTSFCRMPRTLLQAIECLSKDQKKKNLIRVFTILRFWHKRFTYQYGYILGDMSID